MEGAAGGSLWPREERRALGLSVPALAALAGVDPETVRKIERGSHPREGTRFRLGQALKRRRLQIEAAERREAMTDAPSA